MMRYSLLKIRDFFHISLMEYYASDEIQTFFYYYCEIVLQMSKIDVALNPDYHVSEQDWQILMQDIQRLKRFEPIQYIYGVAHFYKLKFKVNAHVLIPRPETEELVDLILKQTSSNHLNILDVGTGSGCIAISLASNLSNAHVYAMDISEQALKIAHENAEMQQVKIQFLKQDVLILNELPEKFDIIVSNPPYVRELEKNEMHANVLDFEPKLALFVSDDDPLVFYRKIAALAFQNLNPNGRLYFEINQYLGDETVQVIQSAGFNNVKLIPDFLGQNRFIFASK
jgi:release factor glutamine methyltransferase